MRRRIRIRQESWPIHGVFRISRGSLTEIKVVVIEIEEGAATGRGECRPYSRYGETTESVMEAVAAMVPDLENGLEGDKLAERLGPGAARNAIDCALWDLAAKRSGRPVWSLAGLAPPRPLISAFTLSVDTPENMAAAAKIHAWRPLLKLKLAGQDDLERIAAVRRQAPQARLIVDANEGWSRADYETLAPELGRLGVEMIEQPFPAGEDARLAGLPRPLAVCADESCHDTKSLDRLLGFYDMVNIKLDKAGGLTEALQVKELALERGLAVMVGCMVATSLGIAPAILVAQGARYVDLDGPLLLARDRRPGLRFEGSRLYPPGQDLWG